jgi:undecaprenyl-diphosphatase
MLWDVHMESAFIELLVTADTLVAEAVASIRTPWLTKLFTSVTGLGSATAAAVLLGLFRTAGWRDEFEHAGVALALTGGAVGALMATVQRPFPPHPVCVTSGAETVATSFPSGHAAAATVFALAAYQSEVLPTKTVGALAVTVALSRVYLGTHYATDTVAGVLIGALAFAVAGRLLTRWGRTALY